MNESVMAHSCRLGRKSMTKKCQAVNHRGLYTRAGAKQRNGAPSSIKSGVFHIPTEASVWSRLKTSRERVYNMLPQWAKVISSEMVTWLSNRPYVYHDPGVHPSNGLTRGAVSFSVDFELAWAWVYAKGKSVDEAIQIGLRERAQVPLILAKMDEYAIPATWATVGHLFLERCERDAHGRAHPDMVRLPHFENAYWQFTSGDWYQYDPCTDYKTDPAWYAPDLIRQIIAANVQHEIGAHSFSHGGFGPYCTNEIAEAKIEAVLEAMRPYGIVPKTWVFPGNDVGNFEAIAKKGFRNVRSFPEKLAEISLPIRRADGMWDIFESTTIDLEGAGWNLNERLARLKRFVDKAASTKLAAHIWFHPSLPTEQMHGLLFPLLKYCAAQRAQGLIDVLTLDGLVDATVAAHKQEGKF